MKMVECKEIRGLHVQTIIGESKRNTKKLLCYYKLCSKTRTDYYVDYSTTSTSHKQVYSVSGQQLKLRNFTFDNKI